MGAPQHWESITWGGTEGSFSLYHFLWNSGVCSPACPRRAFTGADLLVLTCVRSSVQLQEQPRLSLALLPGDSVILCTRTLPFLTRTSDTQVCLTSDCAAHLMLGLALSLRAFVGILCSCSTLHQMHFLEMLRICMILKCMFRWAFQLILSLFFPFFPFFS